MSGGHPNGVTVAFLPATSCGHPYLVALREALERRGARVVTTLPWRFGALWGARRDVAVLHLHWPGYIYLRGPATGTVRAALGAALHLARLLFARLLGYRIVWTVHNLYPHDRTDWPCRLERRVTARAAHAVICHCEALRARVGECFGRTRGVAVIPHGPIPADIAVHARRVTRDAARRFLRVPEGAFLYLFLGEVRPYKGVEDLIDAFAARNRPGDLLLVAGAPVPAALGAAVRARVGKTPGARAILRRIPEHRLSWLLRAADAVVLPYRRVTTSGVVTSAIGAGCRVVVPALGCIPEAVDERFAVVYSPENPTGLADALERVRTLDPDRAREAARARAAEADWEGIAARTLDVYVGTRSR